MIVYRVCKKEEVDTLLKDKSFYNIRKLYKNNDKIYIYFFKKIKDIFNLNVNEEMYFCTYDIPFSLLKRCCDVSFYHDKFIFKNLGEIVIYAIKNRYIEFDYLIKIEKLLQCVDGENYIYDNISSKTKVIYLNYDNIYKFSNDISNNRIQTLYNILINDNIKESINLNLNYLLELIPEIRHMIGFEHKHPHHHLDVWEHTLEALSISENDFDVRLSLLLHDIGKPFSYIEKGGIRHFYGHPVVSSEMSRNILSRLGFIDEYIDKICYLIKKHDTSISEREIKSSNYNLIYTRYLIQKSDALAHHPDKLDKRKKYLDTTKTLIIKKKMK